MIVCHLYPDGLAPCVDHPNVWVVFLTSGRLVSRNDRQIGVTLIHHTSHFFLLSNTYTNSRVFPSEQY
jgi:hypothetical protein